ncbi:acetate--CoA ligase family protein [Halostagnicola kamekurae]|uniref:acetate--CoA ligase (ADP-forming) n=1 Tax=Halostagnicola kamekurae TaxID=619731 RepID=A0A1I6TKE1_9EURY|nr:acetate--CoA ligase family protein [Halostagnicola kamekurae]SFS89467.1 acetyl-CoA synthetase (ADP-forming) [Halostagnicola kamekurae]
MSDPLETATKAGRTALTESEAKAVLSARGIAVPDGETAQTPAEAVDAAGRLGYPVVVKIESPSVQHKSDWGGGIGVALGLEDGDAVEAAAAEILETAEERGIEAAVRVESALEVDGGIEVIVGGTRDPSFGPTVLVGLGGVAVEVLEDTSHRLAPVTTEEALAMTRELEASPLLDGYRGEPAIDRDAVADAIQTVGEFLVDEPSVSEVEVNPLLARGDDALALDALVTLTPDARSE